MGENLRSIPDCPITRLPDHLISRSPLTPNKKAAPLPRTALSIFTFSFLTFIAAGGEELAGFGFFGNAFGGTIVTHRTTETDGIGT